MDAGELVRLARHRAALSQRQLANRAGTSKGAVAALEGGRRSPTTQTLDRMLAACGLQVRVQLEPLLADLDERVAALAGPVPEFDATRWQQFADSLDEDGPRERGVFGLPRSGRVTWAVDGASALVLQGLAVPVDEVEVVVVFNTALRFWMKAAMLRGEDERQHGVQDWFDADLVRMQTCLPGPRISLFGLIRIRVLEALPPTLPVQVRWRAQPVPVVTVDAVERAHPQFAEVLQRWRCTRAQRSTQT